MKKAPLYICSASVIDSFILTTTQCIFQSLNTMIQLAWTKKSKCKGRKEIRSKQAILSCGIVLNVRYCYVTGSVCTGKYHFIWGPCRSWCCVLVLHVRLYTDNNLCVCVLSCNKLSVEISLSEDCHCFHHNVVVKTPLAHTTPCINILCRSSILECRKKHYLSIPSIICWFGFAAIFDWRGLFTCNDSMSVCLAPCWMFYR